MFWFGALVATEIGIQTFLAMSFGFRPGRLPVSFVVFVVFFFVGGKAAPQADLIVKTQTFWQP